MNDNADNIENIRLPKTTLIFNESMNLQENLKSLKLLIYKRLCQLYEKEFVVFRYKDPNFEEKRSADFIPWFINKKFCINKIGMRAGNKVFNK